MIVTILTSCARRSPPSRRAYDEPEKAAAYEIERRSVDGEPVPWERLWSAHAAARRMSVSVRGRRTASAGAWEQLGPSNFGGRTRALLIDPDNPEILYAGSVSGGVWKSADGGRHWRLLDDFLPNLAVTALAFDPKDSRTIYAGTGEYFVNADAVRGLGLFVSENAGETWRPLPSTHGSDFYYVNKVAVSPHSSDRIYAATLTGIHRSDDRGLTWQRILDRAPPHRGCQDIAIRTDTGADFMLAACGLPTSAQGAVLLNKVDPREDRSLPASVFVNPDASSPGGWVEALTSPNMARTSLAIAPSNQNVVYALAANRQPGDYEDGLLAVYRSTEGGRAGSWQVRVRHDDPVALNTMLLSNPFTSLCGSSGRVTGNQGSYDNALAVDPTNSDRVWAGGIDLFRSDDGGASWGLASYWSENGSPQYAHADHHAIVFHPRYDGHSNQILYAATDGGIYRTANAAAQPARSNRAPCNRALSQIHWESRNEGYAVAQFYKGSVYPGGGAFVAGAQDNGTLRGAEAAGAAAWREILGGDGTVSAVDPEDSSVVYAASQNFGLAKSIDGGARFTAARAGIIERGSDFVFVSPFLLDLSNPLRLWTAGKSVWRSVNGAASWQAASAPLAERSLSALAVHPADPDRVLAGSRTGEIFRTREASRSNSSTLWEFSVPRRGVVSSLLHDPANPDTVYATYSSFNRDPGDDHLYRSLDGGITWSPVPGLPDAPTHSIAIGPNWILYVGTDVGLFLSADAGRSWERDDVTFPAVSVNHLVTQPDASGAWLFAFTHGRGLWRTRLGGPPCLVTVSARSIAVPAGGGIAGVELAAPAGCEWSALSGVGWLRIASNPNGAGPGRLRLLVEGNTEPVIRRESVAVNGVSVSVVQEPGAISAAADEPSHPASVGSLPFHVAIDMRTATSVATDPVHRCTGRQDGRSAWLGFVADTASTIAVRAAGSNPVVAVYDFEATRESEVACEASTGEVSFPARAGSLYLIQITSSATPPSVVAVNVGRSRPEVAVAPREFTFPASGGDRRMAIRNAGFGPLMLMAAGSADPGIRILDFRGPTTIPTGGRIELLVRSAPGIRSGTVSIVTNDAATPAVQTPFSVR